MSEELFIKQRRENLEALKAAEIDPYPAKGERTHPCNEITKSYKQLEGKKVKVVGRLMSLRGHGKILFANLKDDSGICQLFFRFDNLTDSYGMLKRLDLGDFIQAEGEVFKTKAGEETVEVKDWKLLSKSMRPQPEKWHGLKDVETRYRKRYLDFLTNDEIKNKIIVKSKIVTFIREFLIRKGFIEVFTPVLEIVPSGAAAKPFKTHLNAYQLDMYLRICIGELWQKMLAVGSFEKTFEIGYAFRNEGVDWAHNPEFLNCEFYWAYADYKDQVKITEEMMVELVRHLTGSDEIVYQETKISFKPPFAIVTFKEAMKRYADLDIDKYPTREELAIELERRGFEVDKKAGRGKLIDDYYKDKVRHNFVQPTFLIDHPVDLSPLAKRSETDPSISQRMQLLVYGQEVFNAYSELNDPAEQRKRFEEQQALLSKGDEEAFRSDEHFLEAMEYGMPPIAGNGIGIERLVMFLTGSTTIREIITFPIMKPDKKEPSDLDKGPM